MPCCPYENCDRNFHNAKSLSNHTRWHEPAGWHKAFRGRVAILRKGNDYGKANRGSNNGMWMSDKVSYGSLHDWVHYNLKKLNVCSNCELPNKLLDAANISGEYRRDLNDWEYICRRCHMLKDGRMKNLKQFQGDK